MRTGPWQRQDRRRLQTGLSAAGPMDLPVHPPDIGKKGEHPVSDLPGIRRVSSASKDQSRNGTVLK